MTHALARRIALAGAIAREALGLHEEFALATAAGTRRSPPSLQSELVASSAASARAVPRRLDLRYRNRVWRPEPIAKAVMFCLMDVSASMDEAKKDLAKRFFTLLYMFLTRKYEKVDLVFIRHTDDAEEVDEETFFHDPRAGGTVVFSALELDDRDRTERVRDGLEHLCGASLGRRRVRRGSRASSARFLREKLLPPLRYYAYSSSCPTTPDARPSHAVGRVRATRPGDQDVRDEARVTRREQIYPVFRELFRKEAA